MPDTATKAAPDTIIAESARGRLGPLTLPSLIHDLCEEKNTGVLTLKDGSREKSIYIDRGTIVFARSNSLDDRLSSLLFRQGRLSLKEMEECGRIAMETGQRFGGVLVSRNLLRPQDLIVVVREQVREIVISLFHWTQGNYRMDYGSLPTSEVITLKMSTGNIVLDGVKQIDSWSRIKLAVGSPATSYTVSSRIEELAPQMNLSLEEWTLLSRCEGTVTLEHLCLTSPLRDFDVCRVAWAFTIVGLLKRQD